MKYVFSIFALVCLILAIVFCYSRDTHNMCFMGILAIWCLTEAHHSGIIDKMKGE
jgi:hypothetical protein